MTVAIDVGTRFPAYATSMGRVLLAGLSRRGPGGATSAARARAVHRSTRSPTVAGLRAGCGETREHGYALVDQELEHGLRSIAAPVRNRLGEVVAAVNVSSHASRVSRQQAR